MKLGEVIKEYRTRNNLSMEEFGKRCGLSKGFISMLEKGQHPQSKRPLVPSLETLSKIATGMGTDLDTFVSVLDLDSIVSVNCNDAMEKIITTDNSGDEVDPIIIDLITKLEVAPLPIRNAAIAAALAVLTSDLSQE